MRTTLATYLEPLDATDDEPSMRTTLAAILRAEGYAVDTVADGLAAMQGYHVTVVQSPHAALELIEQNRSTNRLYVRSQAARRGPFAWSACPAEAAADF